MIIVCPICDQHVDSFEHIMVEHREFWDSRYTDEPLPTTIKEFNDRFSMIGLSISVIEE